LSFEVPDGSTVDHVLHRARDALAASGISMDEAFWSGAPVGIFGDRCERDRRVIDGDRVEIYLPLAVDPKSARRDRARHAQTDKGRNPLTAKPRRGRAR
jgi:putative ubiquitin-RnfH superfamily antitoxin RatB of RatAB toxin-antitoxin module